ncbi:septum formation initiator family protein [Chitinophaga sp.]|uniref:FtsB family cell division protein n=1 Tax=Chitinophaga sp. TaxID=1869181 RepID=UPI002632AD73|nr:septum formation initiator family protein [uncultured Chitinophaga sp.]
MEQKKPRFRIPAWARNKYIISCILFGAWLLFLDRNNILYQFQLYREVNQLENQKDFYQKEISRDRQSHQELFSSPDKLEKFAREQYMMKKDDEDIYIVPTPPDAKR